MFNHVSFIGGGRITRIFLHVLNRVQKLPETIMVSDSDESTLESLKAEFPSIQTVGTDYDMVLKQPVVFIALHPPVMREVLPIIKSGLTPASTLISLAPKWTIAKMTAQLDGFNRIVRSIPNAPSIITQGFNPVAFSPAFSDDEKDAMLGFFSALGQCPVVDEAKLEAYAMVTAMGPTYLWFQFQELFDLSRDFGLSEEEARMGIKAMIDGAIKTLFDSGLSYDDVIDLIPVKPIGEHEIAIKDFYETKLRGLYQKLK